MDGVIRAWVLYHIRTYAGARCCAAIAKHALHAALECCTRRSTQGPLQVSLERGAYASENNMPVSLIKSKVERHNQQGEGRLPLDASLVEVKRVRAHGGLLPLHSLLAPASR